MQLTALPIGQNQLIDAQGRLGIREAPAVRQPFADEALVGGVGGSAALAPKGIVLAIQADNGLSAGVFGGLSECFSSCSLRLRDGPQWRTENCPVFQAALPDAERYAKPSVRQDLGEVEDRGFEPLTS